ncbi:MAG: ABC transporter ATP-binding protein [Planctomycetes bacterium]|nr:ABC transporter ATP-binding protein [Planctomycetota bacterium]
MSDPPPLLAARRLACGRRRVLLRDVDLEVRPGEAWFVLGGNGAGKSTLLLTLLGVLRPLAGEALPPVGGDRAALGYVPQEPRGGLALPCTVAELLAAALPDRLPGAEVVARVAAALAALGIGGLSDRDLRHLSVGERRRAFVARALARQPRLLALDEPAANLDRGAARALAADLDRLRRERGLAVVHVAHDLDLARRFATHAAWVDAGRVVAGPADGILGRADLALACGEERR